MSMSDEPPADMATTMQRCAGFAAAPNRLDLERLDAAPVRPLGGGEKVSKSRQRKPHVISRRDFFPLGACRT